MFAAWLKAAAMGTRRILENFEQHGVPVERITVSGGIVRKNPLFVQLLSDVCQKEMAVSASRQGAALGSAVYAAAAGGACRNIMEAARIMHSPVLYTAVPERNYDRQYAVYQKLSELFMEIS